MKRYIRNNVYKWSDGTSISSNLPRNEFQEKYIAMRSLQNVLRYYVCNSDTYNNLIDKVEKALKSDNFDGNINLTKDEKLLLYLISVHGSQKVSSIIQKFSNYAPRLVRIGEDKYSYCGWTIQLSEDEYNGTTSWACISPNGDWDFSGTNLTDAKNAVNSAIFSYLLKH